MSLLSQIPFSVAASVEAINQKDGTKFINAFSQKVIMVDEGKQHNGQDKPAEWFEEALVSHGASVDVKKASVSDKCVVLDVMMDGDYVASHNITEPFQLYFAFVLENNLVTSLMITDWDSFQPSMKAVWANRANLEDPVSSVRISPRPQQMAPPGWIKVKMQAVGLNYHDVFNARGLGMHSLKFPHILGCEGAGVLEDGTEVLLYPAMGDSDFEGDETVDPKRNIFSEQTNGTLAEYVIAPHRNVVHRPQELSAVEASVLGVAWLTAYRMLFTKSGLRAGQTMLVQGSSGGVTTALIQLGAAAGMRVWCTGRSPEKRELGLRLGAEKAYTSGEQIPEKAAAVFDTSGEVTWSHSMASVKPGGTVVTCGVHSGRTVPTELMSIMIQELNIKGSHLGTFQEFRDLIHFVVARGIKPHIGLVLPIEKADVGFRNMIDGKTEGKIVITV
ncbi:putative zinc-type alcohol dehydrogenase-like protein [Lachnellula willkommii]|uniref:Putative zinc-type alcohol dehydrogenase-like protein n=1 Tax=Lachnellula willkommii TaxID=215461 RepID=A0A559M779_9HELO|nr:putative zinc-type alcohol dehydrogenase-like protein [Lachnellula willkommii]